MDECPPCNEACLLENDTTNCIHPCTVRCHDAVKVLVSDKNFKPAGPWDIQQEKYEIMKLPHPKCEVKVPIECIGGHEVALWPCWDSKPNSCGRLCGRALTCGNHKCEKMCHAVDDATSVTVCTLNIHTSNGLNILENGLIQLFLTINYNNIQQDKSCDECVEMCSLPRSAPGCVHPCERRCHPKPCAPCTIATKIACHCGLTQVYFKCNDLYKENQDTDQLEANREALFSCGNRCIKNVNIFYCHQVAFNLFLDSIAFCFFFSFSSRVTIAVQTLVILAVAKMKNRAARKWKSIACVRIEKLK